MTGRQDLPTEGIYIWRGGHMPDTEEREMIRFGLFYPHPSEKGPEGLSTLDLQSCIFTDKPHLGGIKWNYVAEDEDNIKLDFANAVFSSMEQRTPTWAQAFFERYGVDPKECAQARYDHSSEQVSGHFHLLMLALGVIILLQLASGLPLEGFYFGYEHKVPKPGDQWLIRFGLFHPHPEHPTNVGLAALDFHHSFMPERPHEGGIVWEYHKRPYEHLHLDFTNAVYSSKSQTVPVWGWALFDRSAGNLTLEDWADVPYSTAEGKMVVRVCGKYYTLWLHKRPSAAAESLVTITE
ncbi:hypothetical protein FOZ62_025219 [Perkinsus olseni]|uniref:Uncharacterized protein n=1 Tax=Perkinsus olseni TaxID=32597 RepID=A0A7J6S233_PEROL|nr:hypothetical protein FOZ62_025219 [Perkinsus olseni]